MVPKIHGKKLTLFTRVFETIFDWATSDKVRFIRFRCPGNSCWRYCRLGSDDSADTWSKIYFTSCSSLWNTSSSDFYSKSNTIILFGCWLGCFICSGHINNKNKGCCRMYTANIWNQVYLYDVTLNCKYFGQSFWKFCMLKSRNFFPTFDKCFGLM